MEPPLHAEGTGTARDEWVLSLRYKGKKGAEALAALLADAVGPGLTYDDASGKLQVKLSRDAGNATVFGSDDGVLTAAGDGSGAPQACGKTVADLPERGVTAAYLLAGLINPFNSPYGLQYCITNNIDIAHVRTVATVDGAAWLAEYSSGNVAASRSTVFDSAPASRLDSQTIASTYNTAGNPQAPMPGTGEGRPDGGWYGWLAQKYHNWLLPEALERANGKVIILADCLADGAEGAEVSEAANVAAVLRAGQQMCAQQRMLIGVEEIANATTVLNRGFTPIMLPPFAKGAVTVGTKKAPYPAADLKAAGITWAALSEKYHDTVFEEYRAAGVSVLMVDSARQYLNARAGKVARGRMNMDPVYARGVEPHDYRGGWDQWSRKRMCLGQLSHNTDDFEVTGPFPRGYTKLDSTESGRKNGLVLNARFGGGYGVPSVLVGYRGPVKDPGGTYRITWDAQLETLPQGATAAGKIGVLFGAETDAPTLECPVDEDANPSKWPVGQRGLYRAYLRVNGKLGLGWWDAERTYAFKEVDTARPEANRWMSFVVTVAPDSIAFERTGHGGGKVSITNDAHRGGYLFIEKEELHPEDPKYGFRAGFRGVKVAS